MQILYTNLALDMTSNGLMYLSEEQSRTSLHVLEGDII